MLRYLLDQGEPKKSSSEQKASSTNLAGSLKSHETQAYRNRRQVSGERVSCSCEFTLPNADPFIHLKIQAKGLLIFNVRGGCFYPDRSTSAANIEKAFPEIKLVMLKELSVTGDDLKKTIIHNLPVRRVRLVTDEHGRGVVMRFVNLDEQQMDSLNSICAHYLNDQS